MTMGVFDFKAINRRLNRQDQKAEYDEKNKPEESSAAMYGWPYSVACPLTSLAHPEWPYTGTPHEWPKFKI